jgi:hypothetical protein
MSDPKKSDFVTVPLVIINLLTGLTIVDIEATMDNSKFIAVQPITYFGSFNEQQHTHTENGPVHYPEQVHTATSSATASTTLSGFLKPIIRY